MKIFHPLTTACVALCLTLAWGVVETATAQQQDSQMLERILNPDRNRTSPIGEKGLSSGGYPAREFKGGGFSGVKQAPTREYRTRSFLGIRNAWFGRPVHETRAAREINRYVFSDKAYATQAVPVRPDRDASRTNADNAKASPSADRPFLGRGKSQKILDQDYPEPAPMTIEQVRELVNRNR